MLGVHKGNVEKKIYLKIKFFIKVRVLFWLSFYVSKEYIDEGGVYVSDEVLVIGGDLTGETINYLGVIL